MCELSDAGAYALFKKLDRDMKKKTFLKKVLKTLEPIGSQNIKLVEQTKQDVAEIDQSNRNALELLYQKADEIPMEQISPYLKF